MRDERKRTESDDLAEIEAANERENLRLFGRRSLPEQVFIRKDGVTRCQGPVHEEDFTGPMKDIFIAQYGSWDEYRQTNHTAKWLKENGYL